MSGTSDGDDLSDEDFDRALGESDASDERESNESADDEHRELRDVDGLDPDDAMGAS